MDATLHNAEIEGVADRVTLETADMTALPFPDNSFDVVVSSLAIHNIHSVEGRKKAVHEAYRVAKPGGHIIIADPFKAKEYGPALTEAGATDTHTRSVGWEMCGPALGRRPILLPQQRVNGELSTPRSPRGVDKHAD